MKPALIVVGLGNPGKQYVHTRHNAGFKALDALSEKYGTGEWQEKQKFLAHIQEARILAAPLLLVKPTTYMNLSGDCVRKLIDFYKVDPAAQLLILCDEIDISLGEVRLRMNGGPGTHNGLRSLVATLGEGFPRIRIGVGKPVTGIDLAAYVLSVPPEEERKILDDEIGTVPGMVEKFVLEHPAEH